MQHGDLSNETPKRLLVSLPFVALPPDTTISNRYRRWRHHHRTIASEYKILPGILSDLLRISQRYGLLMELFAIDVDQEELDALIDRLDNGQAHPFTHSQRYSTLKDFVDTLPYRTEVLGVIDEPERGLRYGRWFMSTAGL